MRMQATRPWPRQKRRSPGPLIAAQRQVDRCDTWIRHAREHPGFVDKPSEAIWQAFAAAEELAEILRAEYRRLRDEGR